MNLWFGEGNVGKVPEFKTNANGTEIAKFSIATSKKDFRNKDNPPITTWHNIKVVGWSVNICHEIRKGDKVVIANAEACVDRWTDQQGVQRESHYFLVGIGGTVGISKFKNEEPDKPEY